MRHHAFTGQRMQDRARRTILVGGLAATFPLFAQSIAVIRDVSPEMTIWVTAAATAIAALVVGVLLARLVRQVMRQRDQFDEERRQWRDEAFTDPLCRIPNRRGARHDIERLTAQASESDHWSVAAIDIDEFKSVNDRFGHAVGDRVLAMVASVLAEHPPIGGAVARWGGDEFVVFTLRGDAAMSSWADQVGAEISRRGVPCRAGTVRVSVSIGLSSGPVAGGFDAALAAADEALYAEKVERGAPIVLTAPLGTDQRRADHHALRG